MNTKRKSKHKLAPVAGDLFAGIEMTVARLQQDAIANGVAAKDDNGNFYWKTQK